MAYDDITTPKASGGFITRYPPYIVGEARRAEIAGYISRLPSWGRALDAATKTYDRAKAKAPNHPKVIEMGQKLAQASAAFNTANGLAVQAYQEMKKYRRDNPGSGLAGTGGYEAVALTVTAAVAVALVVFFGASLSPFIAAALAVVAVISALSALAVEVNGLISGTSNKAAGGLSLILIVALAAGGYYLWTKRKKAVVT